MGPHPVLIRARQDLNFLSITKLRDKKYVNKN